MRNPVYIYLHIGLIFYGILTIIGYSVPSSGRAKPPPWSRRAMLVPLPKQKKI